MDAVDILIVSFLMSSVTFSVFSAVGLILNPQFSEENFTVFALIVRTMWSMPFFPKSSIIYAIAYDMAGNSAKDELSGISPPFPQFFIFKH